MAKLFSVEPWLEEDGKILLTGWAKDGLTYREIARNMGISVGTLDRWRKKYPELDKCLKQRKEVTDRIVENALYKKALGFEYCEVTEERVFNPLKNQFEMVVTKKVNKLVLPDTTAQIFWLKNRKPSVWQDRRQIESTEAIEKLDSVLAGIKAAAERQSGSGSGAETA